ncbi:MAG: response regulator [Deltaproteobacteria bacterium]|nr:response regulator [Deltaproteobacteria bacterium]MCW5803164.1 response regulator [Deltaproteobacteria bacterium]
MTAAIATNRLPVVVCVDDDPDMLASVVRILKSLPIELLSTTEPQAALDWVASRDVAVLVSDYEMPEMTGGQLAAEVRKVRPETVRILLTGVRNFATAIEGINLGEVFRYLNKPFLPPQIRDAVTAGIARHRELAASSKERAQSVRRDRLQQALEAEYPGVTEVARAVDGAYVVAPAPAHVAGLGLEALLALGSRQS